MRILFLCNSQQWGGAEMYVVVVARALARRGHMCWVAAPGQSPLLEAARPLQGVHLLPFDIGPKLGRRSVLDFALRWPHYRSRLRALLQDSVRTLGIEALHLQFKKEQLLATQPASDLGLRVIWTEHGRLPTTFVRTPVALRAYRRAALATDQILCVSGFVRDHLIGHGLPEEWLDVCYNGLDVPARVDDTRRVRIREALGFGPDSFVIGTTSRLIAAKGHRDLLQAAPGILSSFPQARFLIVGDGPERHRLERAADRAGIRPAVVFTGHRTDIAGLLSAIDLHVTTSRDDGLPFATLEAMAAGVPVIATLVGGIPEAVGNAGVLVEPCHVGLLQRAILELIDDPGRRAELVRAGRRHVRECFSTSAMIDRTEAAFLATQLAPADGSNNGRAAAAAS
jgi:glycosyltransferase involved in cell wall biosynthesis